MLTRASLFVGVLLLAGCTSPGESGIKAIVGARLEASFDSKPIPYSVILIADGKITAAGPQAEVPVPKGAEITRGSGKTVRPAPSTGRIAVGEPADLVIQDTASGQAQMVMHNGEWMK